MLASDIPTKTPVPFANAAVAPYINSIPDAASPTPGKCSFTTGFVELNFDTIASGGIPPWGSDFNGLFQRITKWLRWAQAGNAKLTYDAAFSTSIGGYPQGAMLQATTIGNGKFWISSVDNNTSNPDTGGANWIAFPDLAVQLQKPNYAVDTGAVNAAVIALSPAPTSFAQIVGAPIRFKIGHTNTSGTPTVKINGLTAATMINGDGTAIGVGQLVAGRIVEGIPCDDGKFQVTSPAKPLTATTQFVPGAIYGWPNETVPAGALECAGQLLNIADHPGVWAVVGTRYGGDGVTTFRMPDFRGEFLRGWDHGRGLDPNAATRTNAGGGATGDHVGTNQTGAAGPISLSGVSVQLNNPQLHGSLPGPGPWVDNMYSPVSTGSDADWVAGDAIKDVVDYITGTMSLSGNSGAAETRPVNIYVMWIMGDG